MILYNNNNYLPLIYINVHKIYKYNYIFSANHIF